MTLDLPSLVHLILGAKDAHVLLSESTCPRKVHLAVTHETDLIVEDKAAFAAGINVIGYIGPEILSESTQLLLEYFDDPGMWQRISKTQQHLRFHKICRI